MLLKLYVFLLGLSVIRAHILLSGDYKSKLHVTLAPTEGLTIELEKDGVTKLRGHIGRQVGFSSPKCISRNTCHFRGTNGADLEIITQSDGFRFEWTPPNPSVESFLDCIQLESQNVSWYGGPEVLVTHWPINKLSLEERPYISSRFDNGAVVEPYWLNSRGAVVFVDRDVPLFVDQNKILADGLCFKASLDPPYRGKKLKLSYVIHGWDNSKEAHLKAVAYYLGIPNGLPDLRMVTEPIWTTWGKYKSNIDDDRLLDFVESINRMNFTKGQIEIDDKWEACYGDLSFDLNTFGGIGKTVSKIHKYGYRATLWVHPFVNTECSVPIEEGTEKGYFVKSTNGLPAKTFWWNGNSTYVIDYTNPLAGVWFASRLRKLHDDYGIDGFKCDAGENDWLPKDRVFHTNYSEAPNAFSSRYISTCANLSTLVEVRSGTGNQDETIYLRMLDKDSVWGVNNGLKAVVHTLLQFNIMGYSFVLPDLIGGNGYNVIPTPELLVRWAQANVFMPSMQFSYLPWDLMDPEFNTTEIIRQSINLHEKYSHVIIDALRNSTLKGYPANPPIWWLDPSDSVAINIDDEFLVGEEILVAPVLNQGATSRDIYLPVGKWKDGNKGTVYEGKRTITNYAAPIEVLPYFIRLHD